MNPTTPSSFIPKRNQSSGAFVVRSGGLFSFVANLIFVIALVASIGVFAYEKYLNHEISTMSDELTAAKAALDPDLIGKLASSDARIIAANQILNNHITLSAFFALLQTQTLQNVRFTSFSYLQKPDGTYGVSMKGEARTYADVAAQADVFNKNSNFINPQFSNLDLNDKGNVTFAFSSGLDPKAISYIAEFNAAAPAVTPSASSSTTTP